MQPHCWDSLTDKGIETETVPCRKQQGRKEDWSWGQTVQAVRVLQTTLVFLVSFTLAGDNGDKSNPPRCHIMSFVKLCSHPVHCPSFRKSVCDDHPPAPAVSWTVKSEGRDDMYSTRRALCFEKPPGYSGRGSRRHVDTEGTEKQLRPRLIGLGLTSLIISNG